MATKAYFLIGVKEEFCYDDYQQAMKDLEAVPEVKLIELVSGTCDLLVQVEAPIRVIMVGDKIRTKAWVKCFNILKVEPPQFGRYSRASAQKLLRAQTALAKG